jgi:hypothetical protein
MWILVIYVILKYYIFYYAIILFECFVFCLIECCFISNNLMVFLILPLEDCLKYFLD